MSWSSKYIIHKWCVNHESCVCVWIMHSSTEFEHYLETENDVPVMYWNTCVSYVVVLIVDKLDSQSLNCNYLVVSQCPFSECADPWVKTAHIQSQRAVRVLHLGCSGKSRVNPGISPHRVPVSDSLAFVIVPCWWNIWRRIPIRQHQVILNDWTLEVSVPLSHYRKVECL